MPFIFIDQGSPSIRHYAPPEQQGTAALSPTNPTRQIEVHSKTGKNPYQNQNEPKTTKKKVHQAQEIMSHPVITLDIQQLSLTKALEVLNKHKIKHLPITQNGTLNAIVSESDILKALAFKQENQKWYSQKVFAATQTTDIHQLAHVMFDEHIGCLPIVDENHVIQGMVTRSDILRITSQYGPMEFWA